MSSARGNGAGLGRLGLHAALLLGCAHALRLTASGPQRFACAREDITMLRLLDDKLFPPEPTGSGARISLSRDTSCSMASALECLPRADVLRRPRWEHQRRACDTVFAMALRQQMRDSAQWLTHPRHCALTPGKAIHFAAMGLWSETQKSKGGPLRLFRVDDKKTSWLQAAEFPHCLMKDHQGLRCFFRYADYPEKDWSQAEEAAVATVSVKRNQVKEVLDKWASPASSTLQLLQFSQLVRLVFNRGKAFRDFYEAHLRHVIHNRGGGSSVGLHIRRGDACNGWLSRTSTVSEKVYGKHRKCYNTQVYAEKLAQMQALYNVSDVYLATTDPDVLDDFRTNFSQQFKTLNWHYLDLDRRPLQGREWYEFRPQNTTEAIGPSSWADLWHLSHGESIIGNMASHFTRSAWQLAMGRQGRFVPYTSVDGRSACCDVGESCMPEQVSNRTMEQCLTYRIDSEQWCFTVGMGGKPITHFGEP